MWGELPNRVPTMPFEEFDVSYNKFSGTFPCKVDDKETEAPQSMNLIQNRFSGDICKTVASKVVSINVLEGNMWACGYSPNQDAYRDRFLCGSQGSLAHKLLLSFYNITCYI